MLKPIPRNHSISIGHAMQGIIHTFKNQPNMRVHAASATLVIIMAVALKVNQTEWLILMFTIMWVMIAEMVNTSIEAIVDLISKEYSQEAKVAKDVAAGTVLLGAVGAIIVAIIIFIPKLIGYW